MVQSESGQKWKQAYSLLGMALLVSVGAALRFIRLGERDFWFDESCTFVYLDNLFDWPKDSNLLVESTNLPYYFLLRGWMWLFGDSEAALRSMSAVAATLTAALLGGLAWRMVSRWRPRKTKAAAIACLVCTALVACHPLHVYYAREARAYALWMLFLAGTLWLLFEAACRSQRSGAWRWWAAYALALLACLHLHYFTIYWVPGTLTCIVLGTDRRQVFRWWLITTTAVGVAFMPYFFAAVLPAAHGGGSAWIAPHWDALLAVPRSLWALMPAGAYPQHLRGLSLASHDTISTAPAWLAGIAQSLPALLIVAALFICARRWQQDRHDKNTQRPGIALHGFLAALTLTPLLLAWAYSLVIRPNYLVGRYDLVAWPAFILWISIAITDAARIPTRPHGALVAAALCVVLSACGLVPIARLTAPRPEPSPQNLRAHAIANLCGGDDLVIALSYDRDYLQYYLHRAGFQGRIISFPTWLDRQIGWLDTQADHAPARKALLEEDANRVLAQIAETLERGGHVWLLLDSLDPAGTGPRGPINNVLATALHEQGYLTSIANDSLFIIEIRKPAG